MKKNKSKIDTPLMRQYLALKKQYADALLFFRLGDFYEMFFDDAIVGARELKLTLTSRDKQSEKPIPMCGVPHHAAKGYIKKLVDAGYKVAICEQTEDPKHAKGVVRREVTQVVTPGIVLDEDHLDARSNNYLVATIRREGCYGIAALDLSTFELRICEVSDAQQWIDEVARLGPREIIAPQALLSELKKQLPPAQIAWQSLAESDANRPDADNAAFLARRAAESLTAMGLNSNSMAVRAGALALRYAQRTQPGHPIPPCRVMPYHPEGYLALDRATLRNLEIFCSLMDGTREGSLVAVIDQTKTAMGGRLMRRWLARPLRNIETIRRRQDAVELCVLEPRARDTLRQLLGEIYDLERLSSRAVMGLATPRELYRLGQSLMRMPQIDKALVPLQKQLLSGEVPPVLAAIDDQLGDVRQRIGKTVCDDPPMVVKNGGFIRTGVSAELDELIALCDGGKESIMAIEKRERARTSITSLKVRYNKVFGYYIEVTKAHLANVPSDYHRKQTLVNAERFVTTELADLEGRVLSAQEKRIALEQQLLEKLRQEVAAAGERLWQLAERLAQLDVICSLAEVAHNNQYRRPTVDNSRQIVLEESRHPVVEQCLEAGKFVPNDVYIDGEAASLMIITGPNMAGKSTVMRQVALIALLGQMGSFVPCRSAQIGVVDRLFTRVGASDNLARGESTFMVEMKETAAILRDASDQSLVILDEIGRGTSTYDGISIAWAVAEQMHDHVRARTLFATHYHELCALADLREGVVNFNVGVQEWQDEVVFLYTLVPGAADRSYGIEVARLAGVMPQVLDRAKEVLKTLEGSDSGNVQLGLFVPHVTPQRSNKSDRVTNGDQTKLIKHLATMDPDSITPIDALNRLAALKKEAKKLTPS